MCAHTFKIKIFDTDLNKNTLLVAEVINRSLCLKMYTMSPNNTESAIQRK